MYSDQELKQFDRLGINRPSHFAHGTEDDIRANLKELRPKSWRLEGNRLIGETEMGPLVQMIPTDYILKGTDDKGLPILEKIVLQ